MGWDIHVGCEYRDINNNLVPGDDYIIHCNVDGTVGYEIDEPIAQYRNYNLFRPLANVRNTVKNIEFEKRSMDEYLANRRWPDYGVTERWMAEQRPETDQPTEVLCGEEHRVHEEEYDQHCDVIRHCVFDHSYPDVVYSVTLDELNKFCNFHFQYHQLREFRDNAMKKYSTANKVYMESQNTDKPEPLDKKNFIIVFGFDY